MVLKVSWL